MILITGRSSSNSQVIGCEDRFRTDPYCVGWGVKLYSIQSKTTTTTAGLDRGRYTLQRPAACARQTFYWQEFFCPRYATRSLVVGGGLKMLGVKMTDQVTGHETGSDATNV